MFSPRRPYRSLCARFTDYTGRYARRYRVGLFVVACAVSGSPLPWEAETTFFLDGASAFAQDASDLNLRSDDAPLASRSYYDGAETIGRVGHEAILRRDILHQLKKFAHMQYLEEIEKIPEDVREERREAYKKGILDQYLNSEEIYTQILDNHIRKLLFYNDYVVSRPKDQIAEQTKQLEAEFESKMVPELKTTFGCKTQRELENYFEREIGTDYAQEKRIFMQQTLGELWMNFNLGEEDFDPTVVDLRRYYDANQETYRLSARVRWQAMTVYFGRQRSKDEARRKIAHMGNAVQAELDPRRQEALFAEVCRVDSEDVFASKGGYRDWTERGTLRSEVVENAIFSEDLPVGALSRILEDENSLTIVRIIERVPERIKSFPEVQEEVREKLIADRREAMRKTYEERLSKRFSIEIYAITPEEREKWFRSAERETESATGREIY